MREKRIEQTETLTGSHGPSPRGRSGWTVDQ